LLGALDAVGATSKGKRTRRCDSASANSGNRVALDHSDRSVVGRFTLPLAADDDRCFGERCERQATAERGHRVSRVADRAPLGGILARS